MPPVRDRAPHNTPSPPVGVPGQPLSAPSLPRIGWARWRDGGHSVAQLMGGAVIGGITAGLVYGLLT